MELLSETLAWLTDPQHWQGSDGIPTRTLQHVYLCVVSLAAGLAIALPLGLAIGHTRRFETIVVAIANLGRAVPSLALLLIFLPFVGIGDPLIIVALTLLSIPPVLVNTAVGIREVDAELVEAGRGMGMSEMGLIRRVELPVALPVVIAGMRIAAVQVVATATLGAVVAGGGLGRYLVDGFALQDHPRLVVGALLVALLAIVTERTFSFLEGRFVSPGVSGRHLGRHLTAAELAPPAARPTI